MTTHRQRRICEGAWRKNDSSRNVPAIAKIGRINRNGRKKRKKMITGIESIARANFPNKPTKAMLTADRIIYPAATS